MDPLNQDHSPYIYCANNPTTSIDPTGLAWFYYHAIGDSTAGYHWHDGDEITTVDQDGNVGTLHGSENFFDYENGRYTYFGTGSDQRYDAWQGKFGYYSYYTTHEWQGGLTYQAQTLGNMLGMLKDVATASIVNILAFVEFRGLLLSGSGSAANISVQSAIKGVTETGKVSAALTKTEIAALRAIETTETGLAKGRQLRHFIASALERRGYSAKEIMKIMKDLRGGAGR